MAASAAPGWSLRAQAQGATRLYYPLSGRAYWLYTRSTLAPECSLGPTAAEQPPQPYRRLRAGAVPSACASTPLSLTRHVTPAYVPSGHPGMGLSAVILIPLSLGVLAFPFFIDGIDINSVGPPSM